MYTQVFGNYLLSKELITQKQLIDALAQQKDEILSKGTLALFYGYMSASEVEEISALHETQHRKFSELAIEHGYLTQEQVLTLLNADAPSFLLLGQILLNNKAFTYEQFSNILADYRSQNELLELEMNTDNMDDVQRLIDSFAVLSETSLSQLSKLYMELLFNNFMRMIGDDFTPLPPQVVTEFVADHCVSQAILGNYELRSYLAMDEETTLTFAQYYAKEPFTEFNEYVQACMEDFLNLHNGLFIVNVSNDNSYELTIGNPIQTEGPLIIFEHTTYDFPICYSFGTVHFLLEFIHASAGKFT